jgi:hypothetical protein
VIKVTLRKGAFPRPTGRVRPGDDGSSEQKSKRQPPRSEDIRVSHHVVVTVTTYLNVTGSLRKFPTRSFLPSFVLTTPFDLNTMHRVALKNSARAALAAAAKVATRSVLLAYSRESDCHLFLSLSTSPPPAAHTLPQRLVSIRLKGFTTLHSRFAFFPRAFLYFRRAFICVFPTFPVIRHSGLRGVLHPRVAHFWHLRRRQRRGNRSCPQCR